MPLTQFNKGSARRNKENTLDADPQALGASSPVKGNSICLRSSPNKKHNASIVQELNQLKIKLSDRDFELKKLEQDCSVKLAIMQKQVNALRNQKKAIIKEWKQKLDEDRNYFQTKLAVTEQEWKAKLQENSSKAKRQTQQEAQSQIKQINQRHKLQITRIQKQIEEIKKEYQQLVQNLKQRHQKQKSTLNYEYQQQIKALNLQSQSEIAQIKQTHLTQVTFYHQIEDKKSKEHNVVSKILSDKIKLLEEELRSCNGKIIQLDKDNQIKKEEILTLKRQKEELRIDKICLERKLNRLQAEFKQKYESDLNKAQSKFQSELSQQKNKYLRQIQALKSLHQQSKTNYDSQLSLLQERCKQTTTLYSTLKSNEEDLNKIQTLEMKLIRKEMELQKQREDVKTCKLQLSNMDQIFHRMFEQAKLKSLKTKKHRLPALMAMGQNRSTMDCYTAGDIHTKQTSKQQRKFSIRQVNYNSISKYRQKQNVQLSAYQ